jgi:hypothetical protein
MAIAGNSSILKIGMFHVHADGIVTKKKKPLQGAKAGVVFCNATYQFSQHATRCEYRIYTTSYTTLSRQHQKWPSFFTPFAALAPDALIYFKPASALSLLMLPQAKKKKKQKREGKKHRSHHDRRHRFDPPGRSLGRNRKEASGVQSTQLEGVCISVEICHPPSHWT